MEVLLQKDKKREDERTALLQDPANARPNERYVAAAGLPPVLGRGAWRREEAGSMIQKLLPAWLLAVALSSVAPAQAVSSAELYQNQSYTYGRFEARIQFAAGDGVISSFFLWKPGSETAGTFWNELDFEKLGADCRMQTNPLYGAPVVDHGRVESVSGDLCGDYHTYTFEWTPTYIAWLIRWCGGTSR